MILWLSRFLLHPPRKTTHLKLVTRFVPQSFHCLTPMKRVVVSHPEGADHRPPAFLQALWRAAATERLWAPRDVPESESGAERWKGQIPVSIFGIFCSDFNQLMFCNTLYSFLFCWQRNQSLKKMSERGHDPMRQQIKEY